MKKNNVNELIVVALVTIIVKVVIMHKERKSSVNFLLSSVNRKFTLNEVKNILLPKMKVLGMDVTYKVKSNWFRIIESVADLNKDTLYRIESIDFKNNHCILTSY